MSESDSVSVRSGVRTQTKLCEGWLLHRSHQRAGGYSYANLWLVLKANILFIFKSNNTTNEPIGSLTIDERTSFTVGSGDPGKGYKFELTTKTKSNKFKSKKMSERELWRGYIVGVARGTVPKDLDLLPDQIRIIEDAITEHKTGRPVSMRGHRASLISGGSSDSHDSGCEAMSISSGFSRAPQSLGSGGSISGSGGSSGGSGGGPTMTNKFHNDRSGDQSTPSWFCSGCSRDRAEQILEQYADHGNTLMRESTKHMKSGSYVISKRTLDKRTQKYMFEHYEVMRVAGGYKLNVQNEHQPMKSLTEVMNYFKETSGRDTLLLDTNDPYRMGSKANPEYDRFIPRSPDTESWTWPPPDYEDPVDMNQGPVTGRHLGSSTVSPGIMKPHKEFRDVVNNKKSVNFQRNTVGPSSVRGNTPTTLGDIEHRFNTEARLRDFDEIINGFETDNVYVNDDPMKNPDLDANDNSSVRSSRQHMPLPPTPHQDAPPRYVNEDTPDPLEHLGVAPPPPRTTSGIFTSPGHRQVEAAKSPISPIQTAPMTGLQHDIAQKRAQLRKTKSEGSGLGSKINPRSPESMPTWDNRQQVTPKSPVSPSSASNAINNAHSVSNTQPQGISNHDDDQGGSSSSGVDQSNPGGVHNLSKMFEQSAKVTARAKPVQRSETVRVSEPRASAGTRDDAKPVNGSKASEPHINSDRGFKPPSQESLSHRRQTDPGPHVRPMQGFNDSFKRRLAGVIGTPAKPSGPNRVDHEYEELPPILPDSVTYANDMQDYD